MSFVFRSSAALKDHTKHVQRELSVIYYKVSVQFLVSAQSHVQQKTGTQEHFLFTFATKCRYENRIIGALKSWRLDSCFFCDLVQQTTLPYNKKTSKRKTTGKKEQTKWRFHGRPVWSIHMLGKPRTRGHPISDWLMTALLSATGERAFSIIDIACFGYTYPSLWIRITYRHSYRLWCHIKWSCLNEIREIAQAPVKHTNATQKLVITHLFILWRLCLLS